MYWRIACLLLFTTPRNTEQCYHETCVPVSDLQTLCNTAPTKAPDAGSQFYPEKPDTCFLYTFDVQNASQKTLAYSIDKCNKWGNTLSLSCILASPQNASEMKDYLQNDILVSSQFCWMGCSKTDQLNETAGDWVWQAAVPPGTTHPALTIPWHPNQPDNNGGNATQCVYNGLSGLSDENADSFASEVNSVQCECVPLPNTNISTATYPPPTTTTTLPPTTTTPDISWMTPKQLLIYENLVKICYN